MRTLRTLAALLAVPALLSLAACSDDDGSSEGSTTTTAERPADGETTTTTALTDEEFASQIDAARASLDEARGDICAVVEGPVLDALPATSEQMREWVAFNDELLEFAASALEGDDPESAEALRSAGSALVEHAEAEGYPPDMLASDSDLPEELTGEAYAQAALAMQQKVTSDCDGPGDEGTTVPEG